MNIQESRCGQSIRSFRHPGLVLAGAVLLASGRAHGDVFNYLSSPVDVTPGTFNAWTDVDVSGSVPARASGVIVQEVNTSDTTNYHYGIRNNGSTDTWMYITNVRVAQAGNGAFFMVGVDANRIFEVYTENAAVKTYLVGYTMAGATFFTNGRRSPAAPWTSSWWA